MFYSFIKSVCSRNQASKEGWHLIGVACSRNQASKEGWHLIGVALLEGYLYYIIIITGHSYQMPPFF
jgi:hypothetical protein